MRVDVQICKEESADWNTFPLAVSYLDRILSTTYFPTRNLPGITAACMLLASKMKATQPVDAKKLVEYMCQFGVQLPASMDPVDMILVWEHYIANKLGWDLSNSTAYEFFDQLMVRAPVLENLLEQFHVTLQAMNRGGWSFVLSVKCREPQK